MKVLLLFCGFLIVVQNIYAIEYSQCGGTGYTGPTTCASGLSCYAQDQYYSQCLASCPSGWACSNQVVTNVPSGSTTTVVSSSTDAVTFIDFGGKIPFEDQFDVFFKYDAAGDRDAEVSLKKPTENWKSYATKRVRVTGGSNKGKAVTLVRTETTPLGSGYVIEVKLLNNGVQTGYLKQDISVTAGKQGFHVNNGRVYDANKNEFIIRGVNNNHADWDNYDRWLAYNALDNIALTKSNCVRIVWRKYGMLSTADLDKIIARAVQYKLVPMIELHDATGDANSGKLIEMAQWFADQVWLLIKWRKYILVNIANEWSPWGTSLTFWRDSYLQAISVIRNAGYSGTLVIDASAYAQNPNGPKLYGQEILNKDSSKNLLFSVHTYVEWSAQIPNYNIVNEFQALKTAGIPVVIGEFANQHDATQNGNCIMTQIDAVSIMRECAKHSFGYLGWSWAGNGQGSCGSLAYLDIALNSNWESFGSYSTWGNILINTPVYGIRDSSKLATIF